MFRETILTFAVIFGLTFSFNASADAHDAKPSKPVAPVVAPKPGARVEAPKPGAADSQKSLNSSAAYKGMRGCLSTLGLQWEGMKQDPKTGNFMVEGPKKNGVPEYYLMMAKNSYYRINTADLKDNTKYNFRFLNDKGKRAFGRQMGWGQNRLWVKSKEQPLPDQFKRLKPVNRDVKVAQWDKFVGNLLSDKVGSAYNQGFQASLAAAHEGVALSRAPDPTVVSMMGRLSQGMSQDQQMIQNLRAKYGAGEIKKKNFERRSGLASSRIDITTAGLNAIAAVQKHRETRPYTPSENTLAFNTINRLVDGSPLQSAYSSCRSVLSPNFEKIFPLTDNLSAYARLMLTARR